MHENRVLREKAECNVLAAEDNPINRLLIAKQLTELNVTFDIVNDGQEAFNKLSMNPQKYDVVLTDHHMPVMDGVTLAKKIRGQKYRFSDIKIVVVTAEQSQEVEGYMLKGIFDDALYKPYKIVDLLKILKSEPIMLEKPSRSVGAHWFHLFPIEESRFMAKIFIKTMVDDSNLLQETIKTDMEQLGKILHRIKGGADAIGAKEIADRARSAELALNESYDEKFILASVNELLNTMRVQIDITRNWLNN